MAGTLLQLAPEGPQARILALLDAARAAVLSGRDCREPLALAFVAAVSPD